MPEAVPRSPRRDDTSADMGSLVQLGRAEAQPIPAAPEATAAPEGLVTADLNALLVGAGIDTAADAAAVQALAALDADTIKTVTRWVNQGKSKPDAGK